MDTLTATYGAAYGVIIYEATPCAVADPEIVQRLRRLYPRLT
ncbi:hypothetical protein [Saccharothrix luteola]|nr:hypothetical protein [Saccharothrix luteola]